MRWLRPRNLIEFVALVLIVIALVGLLANAIGIW